MKKNIIFNITKQVRVDESPFGIVIYIYKDRNNILVEDMVTGKCIQASSYDIGTYLKLENIQTEWKRSFNNSYTRTNNNNVEHFMPLYMEENRYATLTFDIISRMRPTFRTRRVKHPPESRYEIIVINNNEPICGEDDADLKTYNELYKNVKDFETDNFKLEMVDNDRESFYDENFNLIKAPRITCRLPMFQIYSLLSPNIKNEHNDIIRFGYRQDLTVIKIKNKFYRFPYGNISTNDHMCLGSYEYETSETQPESIQDFAYIRMITSRFNGDYIPNIQFNNHIPSCFDINVLREKVKDNNFNFSFMDALFYISQCESVDDINLNMFILTPSIPRAILDFERKLLNKPEDPESLWYAEESTEQGDIDVELVRNPEAGFERGNIETVRNPEFAVPAEVAQVHNELQERLAQNNELRERLAQVGITEIPGGTLNTLIGEALHERIEQYAFNPNHNDLPGIHEYAMRFVNPGPIGTIPITVTVGPEEIIRTDVPQSPTDVGFNNMRGITQTNRYSTNGYTELQANHDRRILEQNMMDDREGEENDTNRESTVTSQ